MKSRIITRREFLKTSSSAAITGTLLLGSPDQLFAESEKKTRVVLVRDEDVLDKLGKPGGEILQRMLDEAVTVLLDEKDPVKAWKQLIEPDDIVGIKSNEWSPLRTPYELEEAIKKRIMDVGVSTKRIVIGDRGVLRDPIFKKSTALINVRPLRAHNWSGVGGVIKNHIMFVRRPDFYHGDSCADLATIWKLPLIEGKTRLNILVLLTPQFHCLGPHHYNPKYVWPYGGLLAGVDPVAVDSTGVRLFQAKRKEFFGEDRPLNPPAKHVFLADTRHHLGTADPEKIDLIKIGWKDGILI